MSIMIERYVIIDENENIIESVDDLPLEKCKHTHEFTPDGMLRVYDRMASKVIARLFTPDIKVNFILASALVTELDNVNTEIDDEP